MKIGTYYYPEQWPREQWERDFENIATMGLQIVHMGEFAWFKLEPQPGDFQLDWLGECLEMARKRKLEVILCTPTAAPPIWLAERCPETLPVDQFGTRKRFGGRRHYSPTSPAMHEASRAIVTALADRFGNHPAVIGWQIDNEYGGEFDQAEHTHQEFRRWLQARYGTIENLNTAWGCQFWSTCYTNFSQILFPAGRNPDYGNPHQHLDASRFWSWTYANFNRMQADILKRKIGNRFITTNFMPFHPDCNPADMAGDLTLMAWDSYPVHGREKHPADENFRVADPDGIGFMHDAMASYQNRWGLMELQPGQVNWSGYPVLPYPGAVRLWLWTAFAHGAEFATTYRYRQPRFGIELFHDGLVGTDGVTPTPGGRQFMQVIQEIKRLKQTPSGQEYDARATVGLVFDFEQLWYYQTLPQAKQWSQSEWLTRWYGAISRLGLKVKILHPRQPWPKDLPMIVAPGLQMVDDALVGQFEQYVQGGGHLVLTCRTGLMDRSGQLWEGPTAKPILSLIGGTIDAYDGLPDGMSGQVEMDDQNYAWGVWGDLLYAEPDTRVLARYADQFYAGAAAVIQKRHAAGTVTYCGVYGHQELTDALMRKLLTVEAPTKARKNANAARLPINPLPPRVRLLRRGPYHILLNYLTTAVDAPASPTARFLVGDYQVEPAGVAVWEE